jgi:hypothetical protein
VQSIVWVGLTGDAGCAAITTFDDAGEAHLAGLVTVNLYVAGVRPEIVVLVPEPVNVTPSGVRLNVHIPTEGNPLNTTLPVAIVHVGWVMFPTTGAEGFAFTVNV